jgi:hypothetical protein
MSSGTATREKEIVLTGVLKRLKEDRERWTRLEDEDLYDYTAPSSVSILLSVGLASCRVFVAGKWHEFGIFSGSIAIFFRLYFKNADQSLLFNISSPDYNLSPFISPWQRIE